MNRQEANYIASVKAVMAKESEPIAIVDELAAIEKPNRDELTLNTDALINSIDTLDWERENGELDNLELEDDESAAIELRIAEETLLNVKHLVEDVDNLNWYHTKYAIVFAFSRLKDGSYTYRITMQPIDAKSPEEAENQRIALKSTAPKVYEKEPEFTLEDVRISSELVDSKGMPVKLHSNE